MGRKRKELSHAEVWDDAALLQSWDDALAEYKVQWAVHSCCIFTNCIQLYHSIHARGERVEDVIRETDVNSESVDLNDISNDEEESRGGADRTVLEDLEDGELDEGLEDAEAMNDAYSEMKNQVSN